MLTIPITTPHFHSRALTLLSNHLKELEAHPSKNLMIPNIPPLSTLDTLLTPNELVSGVLAVVSPWIDLASPDPVVYSISRQVLELEVAYAAFCGIGNIILPSPKIHSGNLHGAGLTQYAYAVQGVLNIGQYINVSISLDMMDNPAEEEEEDYGRFTARARGRFHGVSDDAYVEISEKESNKIDDEHRSRLPSQKVAKFDFFGTWDAWNIIRTICKYSTRLFVGKNWIECLLQSSIYSFTKFLYVSSTVAFLLISRATMKMFREVVPFYLLIFSKLRIDKITYIFRHSSVHTLTPTTANCPGKVALRTPSHSIFHENDFLSE